MINIIFNTLYKNRIKNLVKKYDHIIFISPHLDDAVLSSAMFIKKLRLLNKKMTVITVFTEATQGRQSKQITDFLKTCGYNNSKAFFKQRRLEDLNALKLLGVKCIHLKFIDAGWRKNKNQSPLYPDGKSIRSGNIEKEDKKIIKTSMVSIKNFIGSRKRTLLVAPLGIGNHVDHVLVNKVIIKFKMDKLFWEDYPYILEKNERKSFFKKNKHYKLHLKVFENFRIKEKAIKKYQSQIKGLFPGKNVQKCVENFYIYSNA